MPPLASSSWLTMIEAVLFLSLQLSSCAAFSSDHFHPLPTILTSFLIHKFHHYILAYKNWSNYIKEKIEDSLEPASVIAHSFFLLMHQQKLNFYAIKLLMCCNFEYRCSASVFILSSLPQAAFVLNS
jgi:hypothetical protein